MPIYMINTPRPAPSHAHRRQSTPNQGEKLETKSYVCHWRDDFFCSHTRAEALLLAKNHPSHVTKITILPRVYIT